MVHGPDADMVDPHVAAGPTTVQSVSRIPPGGSVLVKSNKDGSPRHNKDSKASAKVALVTVATLPSLFAEEARIVA